MPRIRPLPALRRTTITLGSSVMVARARLGLPPGVGVKPMGPKRSWLGPTPPVGCPAVTQRGCYVRYLCRRVGSLGFDGLWRRFASDVSAAWSGW